MKVRRLIFSPRSSPSVCVCMCMCVCACVRVYVCVTFLQVMCIIRSNLRKLDNPVYIFLKMVTVNSEQHSELASSHCQTFSTQVLIKCDWLWETRATYAQLSFANSIEFLLIMYRKFILPNLIWLDIYLIWPENVWWLAIIISPVYNSYKATNSTMHS